MSQPPRVESALAGGEPDPYPEFIKRCLMFTIPGIGVVSRDGKHLAALANRSAGEMAQAWHDCLHNNPPWEPTGAPPAERRWRLKVYVMANDAEKLLARVKSDFPRAARSQ